MRKSINLFLIQYRTGNFKLTKNLVLSNKDTGFFVQSIDTAEQLFRLIRIACENQPNALIYRPDRPELIIDYTKEKARLDFSKFATKGTAQLTLNFRNNE